MSPDTPRAATGDASEDDTVTPATLRGITEDLAADELDAPETLKRVWAGLCAARLLGFRLAASGLGRLRTNAESVEHQLAQDLRTTATFARAPLVLPTPAEPAPLCPDEVEEALAALVAFSTTARRRMLSSARLATQWHDERVLRHDSLVVGELAAAWQGHRRSYRVDRRSRR
ncbi:hypothetical protein [Saccharothrix australiensis]|uniref:Uncharacterized protein n=1 Tax=Saccharothrix australiensis TaxID=2072 RepID=A0A495W5P4_9PSEU|nr:hypothetical protein [Saccharothrix australiensis]RKT56972.1 hypothetical protein C8E97_5686 [Saccharothrix australiensis]